MTEAVNIAASKKRAEMNIFMQESICTQMLTDKKIFLLGLAAGLHQIPEVDAQLSDRAKAYIPDQSVAHDFLVAGIETWGAYYEAMQQIENAVADFDAGTATESETIAAIDAIVPG